MCMCVRTCQLLLAPPPLTFILICCASPRELSCLANDDAPVPGRDPPGACAVCTGAALLPGRPCMVALVGLLPIADLGLAPGVGRR